MVKEFKDGEGIQGWSTNSRVVKAKSKVVKARTRVVKEFEGGEGIQLQ